MLQRCEKILVGDVPQICRQSQASPGCMQPFTWTKTQGWEEEEGRLSCKYKHIPGVQES